jgi:hypothetical protein
MKSPKQQGRIKPTGVCLSTEEKELIRVIAEYEQQSMSEILYRATWIGLSHWLDTGQLIDRKATPKMVRERLRQWASRNVESDIPDIEDLAEFFRNRKPHPDDEVIPVCHQDEVFDAAGIGETVGR